MKKTLKTFGMILVMAFMLAGIVSIPANAAAKKTTVYMLSKVYRIDSGKKTLAKSYSYRNDGLLKGYTGSIAAIVGEYKYDKKNRLVQFRTSLNEWTNYDYTYNKQGQIATIHKYYTSKYDPSFYSDAGKAKCTYNKKGLMTKKVYQTKELNYTTNINENVKITIQYSYKNGHLVKETITTKRGNNIFNTTKTIKYDDNGNVRFENVKSTNGSERMTYINTYNSKGRLTKCVTQMSSGNTSTCTYTYIKMKVPNSLLESVKKQQWSLLNHDYNNAIPGIEL